MHTLSRAAALLVLLLCTPAFGTTARFSPSRPHVEPTQKGLELNFDLQVHNDAATAITLTGIRIAYLDAGRHEVLTRKLDGSGSAPNIETLGVRRIDPGAEWLFFNPFPELPADFMPQYIRATLTFAAADGKTHEVAIETAPSTRRPTVVTLPMAGRLRDADGHDALSHHRRWNHALPFLRGLGFASNGMRYAHDFIRADGESLGAAVLAAADGTVARVVMEKPDDRSFDPQTSRAVINALFGNYIVIDHGGVFSLYAHLRQKSSELVTGSRVKAGERIAAVGLSGSADFPHLHFQLMDAPDMHGEGVPGLFRNYYRIRGERRVRVREGAIASGELVEAAPSRGNMSQL
jgi:murein DD-endopeptidase MepM/ murein hydrolase activator NlpD